MFLWAVTYATQRIYINIYSLACQEKAPCRSKAQGPPTKRKSTLSKQSAFSYGAVGGIRKQLRSPGA